MQDYTGTMFNLRGGKYCIADKKGKVGGVLHDYQVNGATTPSSATRLSVREKATRFALPYNEERCIGRASRQPWAIPRGFEAAPTLW